ncbi:hypothetical protein HKX48_006472 [Thoreauomyces humboldtii]|nr:hypothetical protein HKX48_006472 [Thoreauomyces humboldtii]
MSFRQSAPSPSLSLSRAPLLRKDSTDTFNASESVTPDLAGDEEDEEARLILAAVAAGVDEARHDGASVVRGAEEGLINDRFSFKRNSGGRAPTLGIPAFLGGLASSWRTQMGKKSRSARNLRNRGAGGHYNATNASRTGEYDSVTSDWEMEGAGQRVAYGNFTTIDWIHDFSKERLRIRNLRSLTGFTGNLRKAFDACQAWIIVFLVGAVTGILAAYIDVVSGWASDLKEGYCREGFYLNRKFCCWHVEGNRQCDQWATWSSTFNAQSGIARWWAEYFMFILFGTSFALIGAVLVGTYGPYAAGSGIPEVKTILGGFVIRKFLGGWTLLIKCIGLCLAVGSGLSLGKEGPMVHVASCVGNLIPPIFEKYATNEAKKREILSASSAAGVSVAFGAPVGGVLFALEEVSYYFPYKTMWRSFFCAMIAAISLQLVNPFRTGKLVLFAVEYKRAWHGFELPFFMLLGALGGLYGSFFIRMNIRLAAYRKTSWIADWPITEVGVVAFITLLLSFAHPFLRISSADLVANLFKECVENDTDFYGLCSDPSHALASVVKYLILAASFKILLTIFTFGIQVPAGIWIPSMAIGACVGRALGISMQLWQLAAPDMWMFTSCKPHEQCVTPGTYAMVGAAAALAGVTRMTVSLTVIMFELTGALTYILPIMLTVMVAKFVSDALGTEGIYDALIRLNGYPFLDAKAEQIWNSAAGSVMTRVEDLVVIEANGCTIENLEELLQSATYKGYPVVQDTQSMLLIGYAGRAEMRYALDVAPDRPNRSLADTELDNAVDELLDDETPFLDLSTWTDHTPMAISPHFPMEMVMELFKKMGLRYVIVSAEGKATGIITKKDLLRHVGSERQIR